jgi:hypothetical protein
MAGHTELSDREWNCQDLLQWQNVTSFGIPSAESFSSIAASAHEWMRGHIEVMTIGSLTSTERPESG